MAKKNSRKARAEQTEKESVPLENAEPVVFEEGEEEIAVNDPGDCIGHWDECEECEMCEIQDSCKAMTKDINGEENAEKN